MVRNKTNVICLVGDNCTVNQSIVRTMEVPLIGCASHNFNLAVRQWIKNQPELQEIIAEVRKCTCIDFANEEQTHLLPHLFFVLADCGGDEKSCYTQGFCQASAADEVGRR